MLTKEASPHAPKHEDPQKELRQKLAELLLQERRAINAFLERALEAPEDTSEHALLSQVLALITEQRKVTDRGLLEWGNRLTLSELPETTHGRSTVISYSGLPMRDDLYDLYKFSDLSMDGRETSFVRCGSGDSRRTIALSAYWNEEDLSINWRALIPEIRDGVKPEEYWVGFAKATDPATASKPQWFNLGPVRHHDASGFDVSFNDLNIDPNKDKFLICLAVKTADGQIY